MRILVIIVSLLVFGCGKVDDKGILKVRLKSDLTSLDPAMVVDVAGGGVLAKLYNGLVRYDEEMRVVGDLAKEWKVSKDGRIRGMAPWIFLWHLKEYVVHQPWVKDFRLYPIYNADKATKVFIVPH